MTKRVILFKLLGRGNVFAMGRRASLRCLKYYTYEGVLLIHPRMYIFFILFHFYYSFNHFLRRHLGIVLCARYLTMSKKCSNGVNVNSFIQQLHGESMTKAVKGDVLMDSCLADPSINMSYKNAFCNHGGISFLLIPIHLTL